KDAKASCISKPSSPIPTDRGFCVIRVTVKIQKNWAWTRERHCYLLAATKSSMAFTAEILRCRRNLKPVWGGHVWGGHSCPPTLTMKTKPNPSKNPPLSTIRVLIGRARHQAGALSRELRKLGAEVLEIPFIEIRQPRSFQALDSALRNLTQYDWLILTSVNGVEAMWKRMA